MVSARIAMRLARSFSGAPSGLPRRLGEERAHERPHGAVAALGTRSARGVLTHGLGHGNFFLALVAEVLVERHGLLLSTPNRLTAAAVAPTRSATQAFSAILAPANVTGTRHPRTTDEEVVLHKSHRVELNLVRQDALFDRPRRRPRDGRRQICTCQDEMRRRAIGSLVLALALI